MGIVYVLTNESMPGLVKIGMTDDTDPSARMGQLFSTGVPLPFETVLRRHPIRSRGGVRHRLRDGFGCGAVAGHVAPIHDARGADDDVGADAPVLRVGGVLRRVWQAPICGFRKRSPPFLMA